MSGRVTGGEPVDDLTVTWAELAVETERRLAGAAVPTGPMEARWMVVEASGLELDGWEERATVRRLARLDDMVRRRLAGEPLQYVLGHWAFRTLDLMVDPRVLIPRSETEELVGHVLTWLDQAGRPWPRVVDLGTGSGAIALAVAAERPGTEVWATDVSPDAIAVARANLAGLGRAARRVTLTEGDWYAALPAELVGRCDVVVANPPYVDRGDTLDSVVAEWEPEVAVFADEGGLACLSTIVEGAPEWLAPGGLLVVETGESQTTAVAERAAAVGLRDVEQRRDLQGRSRFVLARR